jgi:hypothetical protein
MSAIKDMFYDIESLFIEGYSAKSIAVQLGLPLEEVEDVLDSFGVDKDDQEADAADWDEIEADEFEPNDYWGA